MPICMSLEPFNSQTTNLNIPLQIDNINSKKTTFHLLAGDPSLGLDNSLLTLGGVCGGVVKLLADESRRSVGGVRGGLGEHGELSTMSESRRGEGAGGPGLSPRESRRGEPDKIRRRYGKHTDITSITH